MKLKIIVTVLVLAATAYQPTSAAERTPVSLRPDILVEGPILKLSDLFLGLDPSGPLSDTPIAKAPLPGESVELEARWLAALAKAYGIDWQPRSLYDTAKVERASRIIEAPRVRQAVLSALKDRGLSGNVDLQFDQPDLRIVLPREAGDTLKVGALTYDDRSGRFFAQLTVPGDDGLAGRLKVSGVAREVTEIPVLRHRIGTDETIEDRHIEWLAVPARDVGPNTLLDFAQIVGMSPRRPIAPGKPIRSGDLRLPILVTKNSLVTIELLTDRMRLSVQGRALESGSKGNGIRVMNTQSKKVITAVVLDEDTVEVSAASRPQLN